MKQRYRIEILTILVITLLGIFQGQVTVFYIIYLFWFQEFIRTIVDFTYLLRRKKTLGDKLAFLRLSFGSFFILSVYFVFIVLLFGFMLNWNDKQLLGDNVLVLMFRNWYFNSNILLFLAQYSYFRNKADNDGLQLHIFNRRHIILHISIILAGIIQLAVLPRLDVNDSQWVSLWTVVPFLLLKIGVDRSPEQIRRPVPRQDPIYHR